MMVLKIAGCVFLILFSMNWICLLNSKKIKGFRYGDFVLVVIFAVLIACNMSHIKMAGAIVPDIIDLITFKTKRVYRDASRQVEEAGKNVRVATEFLKTTAKGGLAQGMRSGAPR